MMIVRRLLPLVLFAAAVSAVVTGCSRRDAGAGEEFRTTVPAIASDSSSPSAGASPAASATVPPGPASCAALPADLKVGATVVRQLVVDGEARSYRLHLPAGITTAAGLPVVLNFHGLGSSALEQEIYSGLVPLSDSERFVLVTPDGTGVPRGWAVALLGNGSEDDLDFVDALLAMLDRELCPDMARVYSTGMSNGAFFSSLLGCVRADSVAAIAPVAGVAWSDALDCGRPMPIIAFHGIADGTVPFEGGDIFGVIPYAGAEQSVDGWAGHNGCASESSTKQITEHVSEVGYAGCAAPTLLYAVEGGGHTWPGAIPVSRLGPTTDEIDAASMIWAFFEDKSVPR
ncbi:MAG: PHB depolymerase family esterase [Dehalococcoidia bacterium]